MSPCANCQRRKLPCKPPHSKNGKDRTPDEVVVEAPSHRPMLSIAGTGRLKVGEQFASVVSTLLTSDAEGLLRLALAAWLQRDGWAGDTIYLRAMEKAIPLPGTSEAESPIPGESEAKTSLPDMSKAATPGYLAAIIILEINSMCRDRVVDVEVLLRSIKVMVEARDGIDFQGDIGRELLPVSRVFVIYCALALQEDVKEAQPVWSQDIDATSDAGELRQLASLPQRIRLAAPEDLQGLAQSVNAKIQHFQGRFKKAQYSQRSLLAESFAIYHYFYLEILERAESRDRYMVATGLIKITDFLRDLGLRGHCVANYPRWRARKLINGYHEKELGTTEP